MCYWTNRVLCDRACLTPERLGVLAHVDSSGRRSNALGADTVIFSISAPAHLQKFLLPPPSGARCTSWIPPWLSTTSKPWTSTCARPTYCRGLRRCCLGFLAEWGSCLPPWVCTAS